jgi:hypothetical protein
VLREQYVEKEKVAAEQHIKQLTERQQELEQALK